MPAALPTTAQLAVTVALMTWMITGFTRRPGAAHDQSRADGDQRVLRVPCPSGPRAGRQPAAALGSAAPGTEAPQSAGAHAGGRPRSAAAARADPAAGRPLSSRTTAHTEDSQLPLHLAAQLRPGIAVHTVVRAHPGKFRAIAPHSHDERSYPPATRGWGLPDHDEPALPGHLDPSVAEEKMIHLGRHPEFAGPDPRAHPAGVRMTMPQAISMTQATCASADLDHADLPRPAHRQPLGWQITTRRTPTTCALPLPPAALDQCGMPLFSRGSGTPRPRRTSVAGHRGNFASCGW